MSADVFLIDAKMFYSDCNMSIHDIEAASNTISESSESLSEYFRGLNEIKYLYDYLQIHRQSRTSVLTWTEGRWFFIYWDRKRKFRIAYRDFTHYVISSHAIIEYLTSQLLQLNVKPENHEDVFNDIMGDIGQYRREKRLKQIGALESGELEDNLNRIRGLRNDLAHNMSAQFDIGRRGHPVDIIERIWRTISALCEEVYQHDLQEITEYLEECYREPPNLDIEELPTAKLVDEYQYEVEEGHNVDRFEVEFERRGFDPNLAPDYNTIEHIENLDHMWMGGGVGATGFGLVEILDVSVPDNAMRGEYKDFSMKFRLVDEPGIFVIADDGWNPQLEDLEYYTVLIIDDKVRDVYPATSSGRAEKQRLDTGTIEETNFSVSLDEEGTFNVDFGVYVYSEEDSIEWIQESGPSREISVHGP